MDWGYEELGLNPSGGLLKDCGTHLRTLLLQSIYSLTHTTHSLRVPPGATSSLQRFSHSQRLPTQAERCRKPFKHEESITYLLNGQRVTFKKMLNFHLKKKSLYNMCNRYPIPSLCQTVSWILFQSRAYPIPAAHPLLNCSGVE